MKNIGWVFGLAILVLSSSALADSVDVIITRDVLVNEPLKFKLDMAFIDHMDALATDLKAYEATHKEFKFDPDHLEVWSATLTHNPDMAPLLAKNHLAVHQTLVGILAIAYSGGNASAVIGNPHAEDYLAYLQKDQGQIAADNVRFYVAHKAEVDKFLQDWISLR